MKKTIPILTIVIATYNSEELLPRCLQAVREQSLDSQNYEILVVDGGSRDATKKIAKEFKARVIDNPQKEPVWAKFLGLRNAKGRYLMYLDSDEVIVSSTSLERKLAAFNHSGIRCVIGDGYKDPPSMPFVNSYINEFGDPFSFFIYRLSKNHDFFLPTMRKKYSYVEKNKISIFSFSQDKFLPIIELAAMASVTDIHYLKKHFPRVTQSMSLLPHFFYLLMSRNQKLAIVHSDPLLHYSSDTVSRYLKKILWRVKNNIYHVSTMGKSGFSGRDTFQPTGNRFGKYVFIPYAITIVFPLIDAAWLAFSRKKWGYFIHVPLTLFTAVAIMWHLLLFSLGKRPIIGAYGQS